MTSMTLRKKGCCSAKNPNIVTIALQFSFFKIEILRKNRHLISDMYSYIKLNYSAKGKCDEKG